MKPNNTFRNAEIVRRRMAGEGPREIARQMGLSACVVAGVVHREGLSKLPRGRGSGATEDFKALVRAHAERTSQHEAARVYGIHQSAVWRWVHEAVA